MRGAPARWLLLRGLLREAGHWGPFLDRWREAFPGWAVETPDLAGCGAHHGAAVPTTVSGLLDGLRAERGGAAAEPAWVMGLSLGGMVALEWMARHPGEVAGVVLVSSSAGGVSASFRRCRPAGALALLRAAVTPSGAARERIVFQLTSCRPELEADSVAAWTAVSEARPVRGAAARRLLAAAARFRLPSLPGGAPRPVLVLAGARDRLVHPGCSRALARELRARHAEHPEAGHDLPHDAPDWVIDQVQRWQRQHAAATAAAG